MTATALRALLVAATCATRTVAGDAIDYLRRERAATGLWEGYWWSGPLYPTYQCLAAMKECGIADPVAHDCARSIAARQRADGSWAGGGDARCGSAFETAFALLALALCDARQTRPATQRGRAWLVAAQDADGGWPSAPILAIPPPHVRHRANVRHWRIDELGTGVVVSDRRRLFGTAASLLALSDDAFL